MRNRCAAVWCWLMFATLAFAGTDELSVVGVVPTMNQLSVPRGSAIVISFDRAVEPTSVGEHSTHIAGRSTGTISGAFSFESKDHVVRFTPETPVAAGDLITVVLSHEITAADGTTLREAGFSFQFWTAAAVTPAEFDELRVLDVSEPGVSPRPYGGAGCDLDGDGHLDLAIVNEDTSDVRSMLNSGELSGAFTAFIDPPVSVGAVPSANEAADFNGDGIIDLCTANIAGASASVVFGNGDGTFFGRQDYTVGNNPRGIAVLDADGDADLDIVTANFSSNNLALLRNQGDGNFSSAIYFEGGGSGERALGAADMNNDGIMDLVVGTLSSQLIIVHLGNGDGTFTQAGSQTSGGASWMLVLGDVNGDGFVDVSSGNGSTQNGAILLNDGSGNLLPPSTVSMGGHVVATDLGDVDGDGDLDWVLSSFGAGRWHLYLNDGNGEFSLDQVFFAPNNPACCIMLDIDNDRDLDLALVDEIADVITLMRNSGFTPSGDLNGDGTVDAVDLAVLLGSWGLCFGCSADLNADGTVNAIDLAQLLGAWG